MKAWGVWCKVSNGRTGNRAAWLKLNGTVRVFDTFEAAQAVANNLDRVNDNPHRTASFRYTPREFERGNAMRDPETTPPAEGIVAILLILAIAVMILLI